MVRYFNDGGVGSCDDVLELVINVSSEGGVLRKVTAAVLLICLAISVAYASGAKDPFIYVLGVGQDAGYPQAGCYKPHCLPGWKNALLRRGATSLALVDPEANRSYLFEATPNMPAQLFAMQQLAPSDRYSFDGVFLTHAHIGHYAGLMYFGQEAMGASKVPVYSMPRMKTFLETNGPWSQLVSSDNIDIKPLSNGLVIELDNTTVMPFLVPHRDEFSETVGYRIKGPNKTAIFIPDIDKWSNWSVNLAELVQSVDYALIDATFFTDGELPGRDMSKVPHPLVTESMALLEALTPAEKARVWFIHMNHTNPLLNINSKESSEVKSKGFNIAIEGLRLPL